MQATKEVHQEKTGKRGGKSNSFIATICTAI